MSAKKNINVAILGASGYTGAELIRLLYKHEKVTIKSLIADGNADKEIAEIYPHLGLFPEFPKLKKLGDEDFADIEVAFCCLPHATSQKIIKDLPKQLKIIDLSADFRLYNVDLYKEWYHIEHEAKELQKQAVYGLSEIYRDKIKSARIVACPGCYPTSALLPLVPLLQEKLIKTTDIIIDAKSGITGAGRTAKQDNLFAEVNEGIRAYNIGKHRHMPEIEQILSEAAGQSIMVHFSPQVVPMNRGILSTIYVKLNSSVALADLQKALKTRYKDEPFVHVLQNDLLPSTRQVKGTNHCIMGIASGRDANSAVIVSVIDNLTKGASGQAVQNFNIMCGFAETIGLDFVPQFP